MNTTEQKNFQAGTVFGLAAFFILAAFIQLGHAADGFIIAEVYGNVQVKKAGAAEFTAAVKGQPINLNDTVKTDAGAYCEIAFSGKRETLVVLKAESELMVEEAAFDARSGSEKTLLFLKKGALLNKVDKLKTADSSFQIRTPTSIVGVRGTAFEVRVDEGK